MSSEDEARFESARRIFDEGIALPRAERASFIARECGDDLDLRREVERWVASHVSEVAGDASDPMAGMVRRQVLGVLDRAAANDPRVGATIGKYVITAKIAEGGMGAVYEARQEHPHRTVALKLIHRSWMHDESMRRRFADEIEALAQLDHPGIARVFDAGTHQEPGGIETPFFVMELIDGAATVSDYVERQALPLRDRLRLFEEVCHAVQHAHDKGILHRDIKPSNVLVTQDGHPKVIDFGVARKLDATRSQLTEPGSSPGTPEFMSPEQCEGSAQPDVRSDVYALGAVLYTMLVGRLPFEFPTNASKSTKFGIIRHAEPASLASVDPSLAGDLDAIVAKALARSPADRYASARDLAQDVRRFLNREPTVARPPTILGRIAKYVARRPWQASAALACVALLVTVAFAAMKSVADEERNRAARLAAYRQGIQAAEVSAREHDPTAARSMLEQVVRAENAATRRWEFRHLSNRLEHAIGMVSGVEGYIRDFAVSPDGRLVAALTDPCLILFDARRAASEILRAEDALANVAVPGLPRTIAFTADGSKVWISGEKPGRVFYLLAYDVSVPARPREIHSLISPTFIATLAPHPRAPIVAAGCDTGDIRLWRLGSPDELLVIPAGAGQRSPLGKPCVWALAFDPAGERLAVVEESRITRLWMIDVERRTANELGAELGHFFNVEDVAWSASGTRVATAAGDRTVKIWDAAAFGRDADTSSAAVMTLDDPRGAVLAVRFGAPHPFEAHRYSVATGSSDWSVRLWDVRESRPYSYFPGRRGRARPDHVTFGGHSGFVKFVGFTPDRRIIFSASDDQTIRAWPAAPIEVVPSLHQHRTSVSSVAFSPDDRVLASADPTGFATLWDVRTGVPSGPHALAVGDANGSLAWHPVLPVIATGAKDGTVALWDARSAERPRLVRRLGTPGPISRYVGALDFDGRGRMLATLASRSSIDLWDFNPADPGGTSKVATLTARSERDLACLAVSPDGATVLAGEAPAIGGATGGMSPEAGLWIFDVRDAGRAPRRVSIPEPEIERLAFSVDGGRIACVGGGATVRLIDTESLAVTDLVGHTAPVSSAAWHPDGLRLATGSIDTTIRIWDPGAGAPMVQLRGNVSLPRALAFSHDGATLASAMNGARGIENDVKLWETDATVERRALRARLKEIQDFLKEVGGLTFAELNRLLEGGGVGPDVAREVRGIWARRRAVHVWPDLVARAEGADTRGTTALSRLDGVLDVLPDDPLVLRAVGAASYRAGDFDRALTLLVEGDTALRRAWDRSDYADAAFLCLAAFRLRRHADAARWREVFQRVDPGQDSPDAPEVAALRAEIDAMMGAAGTTRAR